MTLFLNDVMQLCITSFFLLQTKPQKNSKSFKIIPENKFKL